MYKIRTSLDSADEIKFFFYISQKFNARPPTLVTGLHIHTGWGVESTDCFTQQISQYGFSTHININVMITWRV